MAKSNKLLEKGVEVIEIDGELILKGLEGEELKHENLTKATKELSAEHGRLTIEIKKYRKPREINRKPQFKYRCASCNKEVKSKEENLKIICEDCNVEYEEA